MFGSKSEIARMREGGGVEPFLSAKSQPLKHCSVSGMLETRREASLKLSRKEFVNVGPFASPKLMRCRNSWRRTSAKRSLSWIPLVNMVMT